MSNRNQIFCCEPSEMVHRMLWKGGEREGEELNTFYQLFSQLYSRICTCLPGPFASLFLSLGMLQRRFALFLLFSLQPDLPGRMSCSTFSSPRSSRPLEGSVLAPGSVLKSALAGVPLWGWCACPGFLSISFWPTRFSSYLQAFFSLPCHLASHTAVIT